jgi:hypothetical protein
MGEELFRELISGLNGVCAGTPDGRRRGYDWGYEREDAVKCGFSLFFCESLSVLDFQRKMKEQKKRDNLETLFGVKKIPCDNELRNLLDPIEPEQFAGIFRRNLDIAEKAGMLEHYETAEGELPVAIDGTGYFSSKKIHCEHCLHKKGGGGEEGKEDEDTRYYHTALCGAVVKPGSNVVVALMPEFIRNEDGDKKQDCERNAGKRLLDRYQRDYGDKKLLLLADDLYSNDPFCRAVKAHKMSFIFTCKETSHPWLTETIKNSYLEEERIERWNPHKKRHEIYTYQWLNGVPLRDEQGGKPGMAVNYFSLTVTSREKEKERKETGDKKKKKQKPIFYNSWVTDKEITRDNVATYAEYGRARWKIENENNNVLKERGYNLEHNYGHGNKHLSEVFCLLNILAFMTHSILDYTCALWQKARKTAGRRDTFFFYLNAYLRVQVFPTWESLLHFLCQDSL